MYRTPLKTKQIRHSVRQNIYVQNGILSQEEIRVIHHTRKSSWRGLHCDKLCTIYILYTTEIVRVVQRYAQLQSRTHADMILTAITPNIIRHLKSVNTKQTIITCESKNSDRYCWKCVLPDDEDALRQFPGPLPQRVTFPVAVDGAMLIWDTYVRIFNTQAVTQSWKTEPRKIVVLTLAGSKSGG